jgi:cobalt-zinc-cadmium efflux system outer membrane protein
MSIRLCRRPLWLCAMLLLSQYTGAARAQDALTLQDAVERALAGNLDLKSFGYELAIQEGRIQKSTARPPLEFGLAVENVLGRDTHSGIDAAETTLSIGWVWERGVRDRRIDAAHAGLVALQIESQLHRLDVATETARRFLTALTHQQELIELQRALALAEETYTTVQARVAAAKAPEAESARAFAQLARAKLDLEHVEHEMLACSLKLTAMWGARVGAAGQSTLAVRGDIFTLPPLPAFAELHAGLRNNPNLEHLLTTQRLRDAELALAMAQRRPAWRFNAGVRRFETTDDQALVFGFTAPLANRAQSQGAIATARAQAEQTRAHSEALDVQLGTELFAVYQEMNHAYTAVAALRDEVLPRMETALEQSRYAYERGRYSYAEWLAAQREVTEVRMSLLEAAANAHRYRIEIERLTGAVLAPRVNQ